MKKTIPDEVLEAIVVDKLFFKKTTDQICEEQKLSKAFVNATVATYNLIKAEDWDQIKFMLAGKQMTLRTVEWAAGRQNVTVPESFYETEKEEQPPQLEGQTQMPEVTTTTLKFGMGANNTLHALIDAINRNTAALNRLMAQGENNG